MNDVIVLGAGMVGVSTALALQERGLAVTLVDRRSPGRETSFGNAGIIQAEAVEPYALPRNPLRLARFALKRDNAVHYHWRALPGMARSLLSYFFHSSPSGHRAASAHYSGLIRSAVADHAPLVAASGADLLIRRNGYATIFRSEAAFAAEWREAERLVRDHGIGARFLDGAALATAEPALQRRLAGAIHWHESWSCADPGALVAAYAQLFEKRGGLVLAGDAAAVEETATGWRMATEQGKITAAHLVVALGPWSPAFLKRFSYRVPMVLKRGYHRHYQSTSAFSMPLYDTENSYLLCPMRQGLRLTTGAELAREGAALTPVQLRRAERAAHEIASFGAAVESEPWTGVRPCMPDMLPVIGPLPCHKNLWANFGHGHQGFTLGPTTGRWLAQLLAEKAAPANPFAPARLRGI